MADNKKLMRNLKTAFAPPSWLIGLSTGTVVMGIPLITPVLLLIKAEMGVKGLVLLFGDTLDRAI